jgi:hypothetical protein
MKSLAPALTGAVQRQDMQALTYTQSNKSVLMPWKGKVVLAVRRLRQTIGHDSDEVRVRTYRYQSRMAMNCETPGTATDVVMLET